LRLLLVDDDASLRQLVRTTFELADVAVDEADGAAAAMRAIAANAPDVIVLDVRMPRVDGFELCRRLKADPATASIPVILLSGSVGGDRGAPADAFLRKPFSPLELLALAEDLADGVAPLALGDESVEGRDAQLLLYARDLRRVLDRERRRRALLQKAYRETVVALASALDSKDRGTSRHSQRVQHYAVELARVVEPSLIEDPAAEYGFLLHDVGKIGIPDRILQKPGPLNDDELSLMRTHTLLGEQMLAGVAFLRGAGVAVVRHHHERWDGAGYPDGLAGTAIPLSARIFAVADALDAMTNDRPYGRALSWTDAVREIHRESGGQFDPAVVDAFDRRELQLRSIHRRLRVA